MTALAFPDPPLRDGVVALRPWGPADVETAHRATQDPLITRFTRVRPHQSLDDVRGFYGGQEAARTAGEALELAIADATTNALLGTVALLRLEWAERRCEIGYWVAPWARGRGVATRAVGLLSPWTLRSLDMARLALVADVDNVASQRVAERCGFVREGVLRSYERQHGARRDVVVYALLPADLPGR